MALLKSNALPNSIVAHGLNHLLAYQSGEVKRYRKEADNSLLLRQTYLLADVKRLAISEDGLCMAAQTATQTHRLHMPTDDPLATTGAMAISDSNFLIVLQPTAVQVIRETTVLLTATTTVADKVCCGLNSFVVYNSARTLTGTYTGFVLTNTAQAKTLMHVAHTGSDKFAFFYSDGSVTLSGTTRTAKVLRNHRHIGQHVVANDGTDEWTYMRKFPLTAPVKLRPYVEPPAPADFFTTDTGGAPLTYTIQKTAGASVDEPAQIGTASYTLQHGNQDSITILLDQPINLAATDWTLEWTTLNQSAADGSYYAEIAMLPAAGNLGVVARYGDGGYGNRLQFGGLMSAQTNVWNANYTKATLNGVLRKCVMVKQGTTVSVYINDVRQNLAIGTTSTYDQTTFTIDTDITAIKRIVLGATPSGGGTIGAIRGPVKLSLSAKRPTPEPFSLFKSDGSLATGVTNSGATVAPNLITFSGTSYLSMPGSDALVPRTDDFEIDYEVLYTSMPAAVSGTSLQPVMYWGNWATPGQPVNMDMYYINTAPARHGFLTSHDTSQFLTHNVQMSVGQWYAFKWARKSGVLKFYIDGTEVASQDFPYDITYKSTQPLVFGRRRGGTSGTVYWYAQMQLRKFTIKIG